MALLRTQAGGLSPWLVIVSVLALFLGFYSNMWRAAPDRLFEVHQRASQSKVVGRLAHAQRDGLFAHAGLLGRLLPPQEGLNAARWQYALYERDLFAPDYEPYFSHPGGQGFILSLIDYSTDFSNRVNFKLFQAAAALFTAIVLVFFFNWIKVEFGWAAFILVFLTALYSLWLTVFGRNLYWFTGIFFVPMLVLCVGLQRRERIDLMWIGRSSTWTMLLKCVMTGFEFISTTTVMAATPIVYFAVRDRWSYRRAFLGITAVGVGAVVAVLLTSLLLVGQIASVRGGLDAGVDHLAFSLAKRTHGDPDAFKNQELQDSLEADVFVVLRMYLEGYAFWARGLTSEFGPTDRVLGIEVRKMGISYLHLIFLFVACSIVLLYLSRSVKNNPGRTREDPEPAKALALCATTWWAVLAPLSWFVIFKGHAYVHPHVDFIAWHMPFTFFGMALVGYCAASVFRTRIGSSP